MASIERRNPGIGVWFRSDVLDILSSVDAANWDIAQHLDTPEARLYRLGFEAAMRAVALNFGLSYAARVPHQPSNAAGQFGGF